FDAAGCVERLHASLESLLEESRARRAAEMEETATHWDMGHEVEGIDEIRDEAAASVEQVMPPPEMVETELVSVETPAMFSVSEAAETQPPPASVGDEASDERRYRVTDLSGFQADPDQFFEFGYRDTLRGMIEV
ncbi:hypothetical protein GR242_38130, partial [Rhizobium leguminosarum]|nr:hypothetical protein [Rhizobium ruizarguesonis]